jgi:ABC-type lipoprotein release transport system permease subunit
VSLLRFSYLRRKRLFVLVIVLALASTLFSVTAYSFLGFYSGFTGYVGAEGDVVAVYSRVGNSPFSGLFPLSIADKIASARGVVALSPEVIAPASVEEHAVFIRGVIPQEIAKLNQFAIIEGQFLDVNDSHSAAVGVNLAKKLQLKTGDTILALGVLSNRYVELQIAGVYHSGSSLDDEALVPIYVGQWIRGTDYTKATLMRVKIDPAQTDLNTLYSEIANTTTPQPSATPSPTQKSTVQHEIEALLPLSKADVNVTQIGIDDSKQFMQTYLNRYGVSKDTLIVLSAAVLVFASGTAACAIGLFVKQHSSDIETLRSIGVSNRAVKADLSVRLTFWAAISTLIGTLLSAAAITYFQSAGYLEVLSHTIVFQLDPLVATANFFLISCLAWVCVARMELKP